MKIKSNKAKNGGAVYNIGLITDITSSFSDNETNENGGAISNTTEAIWVDYEQRTYTGRIENISGVTFLSNISGKNGGAIYNDGTITAIKNNNIALF